MTSYEKAQQGLALMRDAIVEILRENPQGLRNVEIASILGIRSDHEGQQVDYLSYSLLGLLMRSGIVTKTEDSLYKLYKVTGPGA